MKVSFRSELSKAKGHGSSKTGTQKWWMQRVSAIALIPVVIWFVYQVIVICSSSLDEVGKILSSPINALVMVLFLGVGIYHSTMGMIEIVEDYIHCRKLKVASLLMLYFVGFVTALCSISAVFIFHFNIFKF